jgi:hypothetical protein
VNDRVPCEFFLIRYVPDAVKGEYTNIGVLLREAGREESARVRFTRDWSRVRCMDADADIEMFEALEGEIDTRLRLGAANNKPMIAVIEDTFSNSIQMTEARACLAENLATELELLMQLYVEPLRVKQERKRTGRAVIAGAMRTHFERAGVLAYTAPRLREGVVRVEGARLELTAVVEPLRAVSNEDEEKHEFENESVERYRFGVETMESQQIRVLTMNDLARAAQTARIDLRL